MPNSDPYLRDGLTPNTDVELYESAAAGSGGVTSTIAYTEADDTAALTGALSIPSAIAYTEADDTAALSGTVANPVSGTIAYVEADDTAALTGTGGEPAQEDSGGSPGSGWGVRHTKQPFRVANRRTRTHAAYTEADDGWDLTGSVSMTDADFELLLVLELV